jgi:putative transposase
MAGTFTALHYHLVFSTKERFPFINDLLQERLYEYMGGIIRSEDGMLLEIGGMPDHVHLLVSIPAKISVSDFMRILKSKSSGWVRSTFPEKGKFAWQDGYGAFTVSRSELGRVTEYIRNQQEHHRVRGFQEEFLKFLEVHKIKYDERYIWK